MEFFESIFPCLICNSNSSYNHSPVKKTTLRESLSSSTRKILTTTRIGKWVLFFIHRKTLSTPTQNLTNNPPHKHRHRHMSSSSPVVDLLRSTTWDFRHNYYDLHFGAFMCARVCVCCFPLYQSSSPPCSYANGVFWAVVFQGGFSARFNFPARAEMSRSASAIFRDFMWQTFPSLCHEWKLGFHFEVETHMR